MSIKAPSEALATAIVESRKSLTKFLEDDQKQRGVASPEDCIAQFTTAINLGAEEGWNATPDGDKSMAKLYSNRALAHTKVRRPSIKPEPGTQPYAGDLTQPVGRFRSAERSAAEKDGQGQGDRGGPERML